MRKEIIWILIGLIGAMVLGIQWGMILRRKGITKEPAKEKEHKDEMVEVKKHREKDKREVLEQTGPVRRLYSPVMGEVKEVGSEENRKLTIRPVEDRLVAPLEGKVVRIGPVGNEFVLRSKAGFQVLLWVAECADELSGDCFRPKVILNEIVRQGQLLMEFDRGELTVREVSPMVTVSVASEEDLETECYVQTGMRVQEGTELLKVHVLAADLWNCS